MGRGRKNLKRAVEEDNLILQPGQSIMQVVSLRGSNLIEVMDAKGEKSLALFPAKFQKSMWIKRGSFVVVDESGREQALESGSKVACIVSQVLFHEQVRRLRKSPEWNRGFTHEMCDPSFHCERYWDTTNTVHFLSGEIIITPQDLTMLVANWVGLLWTSPNHLESFSKSCGIRGQKPSDHKPMINPVGIFQNLPQSKMEKKQAQVTTTAFPHLKLT